MYRQGLTERIADAHRRTERIQRILKYVLHFASERLPVRARRDWSTAIDDLAACRLLDADENARDGRLARAALAYEPNNFAWLDTERHMTHRIQRPRPAPTAGRERLDDVARFDRHGRPARPSCPNRWQATACPVPAGVQPGAERSHRPGTATVQRERNGAPPPIEAGRGA